MKEEKYLECMKEFLSIDNLRGCYEWDIETQGLGESDIITACSMAFKELLEEGNKLGKVVKASMGQVTRQYASSVSTREFTNEVKVLPKFINTSIKASI
jgi:hypothetical protein